MKDEKKLRTYEEMRAIIDEINDLPTYAEPKVKSLFVEEAKEWQNEGRDDENPDGYIEYLVCTDDDIRAMYRQFAQSVMIESKRLSDEA